MQTVTFWKTAEFKKIQDKWYEELKSNGFIDAERDQVLIQNSPNAFRQAPEIVRENKTAYYNLLAKNLEEDPPLEERDRLILQKRSEGFKINDIVKDLELLGYKHHRQTVRFIIRKYEAKWKIKKWTKNQIDPPWWGWRDRKKVPTE